MSRNINHQFALKVTAIIQQILTDKVKPDSSLDYLDKFFAGEKGQSITEEKAQAHTLACKQIAMHYFVEPGRRLGRGRVPFSREGEIGDNDRKFFIDSLYKHLKGLTRDFKDTHLYFPRVVKKEGMSDQYVFSSSQVQRIFMLAVRICYEYEGVLKQRITGSQDKVDLGKEEITDKQELAGFIGVESVKRMDSQEQSVSGGLIEGEKSEEGIDRGYRWLNKDEINRLGLSGKELVQLDLMEEGVLFNGQKMYVLSSVTSVGEGVKLLEDLKKISEGMGIKGFDLEMLPEMDEEVGELMDGVMMKKLINERIASVTGMMLEDQGMILKELPVVDNENQKVKFRAKDRDGNDFEAEIELKNPEIKDMVAKIKFKLLEFGQERDILMFLPLMELSKAPKESLKKIYDYLKNKGINPEVLPQDIKATKVQFEQKSHLNEGRWIDESEMMKDREIKLEQIFPQYLVGESRVIRKKIMKRNEIRDDEVEKERLRRDRKGLNESQERIRKNEFEYTKRKAKLKSSGFSPLKAAALTGFAAGGGILGMTLGPTLLGILGS